MLSASRVRRRVLFDPTPATRVLRRSGRTLHDALDHHGRDAREHGLGLRGRQYVDDRVRSWRLRRRLGIAAAEDIPELTGLLMEIGEHLAQVLRIGCYPSRQLHAARCGSLLQLRDGFPWPPKLSSSAAINPTG
jgi:hypothetical protein